MGSIVQVTIPWPPTETSSNASRQGAWRRKSEAAKKYKTDCAAMCLAQKVRPFDHEGDLPLRVIFCPPSNRRIDWDNASNRCKQGFDAVAEAIGIDDGRWWPVLVEKGPIVDGGKVVLVFGAAETGAVAVPFRGQVT